MNRRLLLIALVALCETTNNEKLKGSTLTIGPNGINSAGLTLANGMPMNGGATGATPAVAIGQIENVRPGKAVADGGPDDDAHSSRDVVPAEVFRGMVSGTPIANLGTTDHPEMVASVMIGKDATDPDGMGPMVAPTGVALGARLYAAQFLLGSDPLQWDQEVALEITNLIDVTPTMPAINLSFGRGFDATHSLSDGNQHLTQFIDWSAKNQNILYLIAGEQGNNQPIPKDNFNGMTIARSAIDSGVYRRVSPSNDYTLDAEGDRTSISLLAPVDDVDVTALNSVMRLGGTSFATPHVTGTVALLHQYANERSNAGVPGWNSLSTRRHEVMKAVLMNSADKLIDDGSIPVPEQGGVPGQGNIPVGSLLGMSRTVLKKPIPAMPPAPAIPDPNWFNSPAWDDSLEGVGHTIPLDIETGAGHLNASRARTQYAAGEYEADGTDIPTIGWDYGATAGEDTFNRYRFAGELLGGSFISISLAWDRKVEFLNDIAPMGEYSAGDNFKECFPDGIGPPDDSVISDLDILLLPKFAPTEFQTIALSDSAVGTVEHLFFQIPETGEYEFWIKQHDQDGDINQNYGVAWWAASALPNNPPGDYNGDQVVDAQDYTVWRGAFGGAVTPGTGADGNNNGVIDAGDYVVWRKNATAGSGSSLASVPEPSIAMLLVVFSILLGAANRSRVRYGWSL